MNDEPIILIDASSFLYRAFHAMPDLRAADGRPTGAIYGVANMLRRLLREHDPRHLAAVFDAPGPTFRHARFTDYKAQRPAMPDDLVSQIGPIHELVQALGLPLLCVPGVEADDVIGTLACRFAADRRILIVTGDKDMAQLVTERIHLLDTLSERYSDPAGVEARFGVPPRLIGDWLALVGDTVDNIPGVPGVGPKTASKWLQEYGSLDALIAHADEIKGKVGDSLRASLDQLAMCRELAAIDCRLELPLTLEDIARRETQDEALKALFRQLGFNTWLRDMEARAGAAPDGGPAAAQIDRARYRGILDEQALDVLLGVLDTLPLVAVDTETNGLNPNSADLVGISFAWQPDGAACPEAVYIPLRHAYLGAPAQLSPERVRERLRPFLEDPRRLKIGQNLKFDLRVFARHGIRLAGVARDTMLESFVLNSTAQSHDLDTLAERFLKHRTITFHEVAGKGKQQITFDQVPIEQAVLYAAEDADVAYRLDRCLWPQLQAETRLRDLFERIEMPLVPVLARMETVGVRIDPAPLKILSEELAVAMADTEAAAHAAVGQPFNLNSPKQIQEILFEKLQLPVQKKTPGGVPSTSEEVLSQLAERFPLPGLILEYRGLAKLKSTYADALARMIDPATGRVHTSFHQAVASTGRLSSSDPNLQNIPVRTAQGRRIRQAFVAEAGCLLVSADYSQIELRIMAHLSGDEGLLRAFREERDVHQATAAEVFGVALEQVEPEQRRRAKAINFGLIYGMSAFGLARELKIERREAQRYVDLYFERYPGVRRYMDEIRQSARERGYVETLFGRRLHVPEIQSGNAQRRAYAERTAINAPMQGTAADIVKRAMIAVDQWLLDNPGHGRMILQVHDELVLEVPEATAPRVRADLPDLMCGVAELKVPLRVSVGCGKNWDEAH